MNIRPILDQLLLPVRESCGNGLVYKGTDNDNISVTLYRLVEEATYRGTVDSFVNAGFRKVCAFTQDNFEAEYYLASDTLCGFVYDRAVKELRVITDDNRDIPSFEALPCENKSPVLLWQYEIDHSLIDCGMCYIIRLPDYSFFIIDTPHFLSVNDDNRIYDFLKSKVPAGQAVVVSGWFFTHGHDDHIGKFTDILKYNRDIEIRGVYFNFPNEEYLHGTPRSESDSNKVRLFRDELARHSDIPVYNIHSGQRFFVKDIAFDVLCSHEDVYPAALDNYNDSSSVLMMTVGKNKVCFPGDAGAEESAILERRFPSYLKCDIVQAAHHGHFGCTPEFYRLCSADTVLFPVTKIMYDGDYPRYEANRTADALAKHNFIASDGTAEFTFPLENSDIVIYPDETFENFEGIFNLWGYQYTEEYKVQLRDAFLRQRGKVIPY